MQEPRGCREPVGFPTFTLDGEDYFRCPVSLITPFTNTCLRLYGHYKAGFLPAEGGILDQAQAFLDAMVIIESAVS